MRQTRLSSLQMASWITPLNPTMFGAQVLAIKVLLDHVEDMDRAHEYATKVDEPEVWSELAHVELDRDMVSQAIASYLRAGDASRHGSRYCNRAG